MVIGVTATIVSPKTSIQRPSIVHDTKVAPVRDTAEGESRQVLPERSHTTEMQMEETRGEYVVLRKLRTISNQEWRKTSVN